ncbi:unnamed protein product [Adineta steineri]|uniref:F-box domain-containing protein n=1 Tax=Adineta steineri TaxID=433720 RepID=A0A818N3M6_9BILA|nr:unnamed protein product [Adineta steineri]
MSDTFIFEQLPNEIFQELFEYFHTYELYEIFSQLNSRFNFNIKNFKYLQLILYSPEDINHRKNQFFLSKIKTLIIDHTKYLYDPIKPPLFLHIRCLILCQPTREQWNSIHPFHFPYLERLHLINSRFIYRTEQLCRFIFSNQFRYLYSCSLPHISYDINNQWTGSIHLQILTISIWDIRVYTQILHNCPNLIRLKIELSGGNNQENLPLCNTNEIHSNLRYLTFYSSNSITCELIDSILSFVPNLTQFLLRSNHQPPNHISVNKLASILESRTSKLNRINIDITVPDDLCCKEVIDTKYLLFKSYKIQSKLNRPTKLLIVDSV